MIEDLGNKSLYAPCHKGEYLNEANLLNWLREFQYCFVDVI